MPIIDPAVAANPLILLSEPELALFPRSELRPVAFPVAGAFVAAGTATEPGPDVEVYRAELRIGNLICIGLNCTRLDGDAGQVIDAIPQFSNNGVAWKDVGPPGLEAIITFSTTPTFVPPLTAGTVGVGYVQAFIGRTGIPVNPWSRTEFVVAVGARFFRVVLRSAPSGSPTVVAASGVFDAIGVAAVFPGIG